MSEDNDKLLDHEYDGIQELDNNLPTWWLWTFFITIIFGALYWMHYSLSGDGPTLDQELAQGMTQIEQMRKSAEAENGGDTVDETTLVETGQKLYTNYCAACHKADGGGSVGPNLTDKYWIHGQGSAEAIKRVIEEGVLDKGMPAWKQILKPKDVKAVLAFVETLRNTNAADGKAAQGQMVE